jgi:predicted RNA binding protein YcfA (HicA-like mRNA interferase family)
MGCLCLGCGGRGDVVNVRDVLKLLRRYGSHRQFIHLRKPGKVTVALHESDEMPPKTLKSKMKQADIA